MMPAWKIHRWTFRFDYGYGHAFQKREHDGDGYVLHFPRPVVIYLYYEGTVPDEYTLTLEFDEGKKTFEYTVPVVKLTELSVEELNRRKMVILIPFHLLKLKQWLKEGKVTEESLRKLVHDDIIGSINENQRLGNISTEDALKLKRYTGRLSRYLYQKLQGEGLGVLMEMTDESFMTDVDLFFEAYHAQEDALKEKDDALKEQEAALKEKDDALKEKDDALKEQEKAACIKLVRQVCRNREKGKSPEMIAEDLIEPVDVVKKICEIRDSMERECDPEEIFAFNGDFQSAGISCGYSYRSPDRAGGCIPPALSVIAARSFLTTSFNSSNDSMSHLYS